MIEPHELMQRAIDKAREGIAAGQTPFGCAIANDDGLLVVAHNTVIATTDVTAHAEVNALRKACLEAGRIHLSDCWVATTCEPCAMCMAALHWARVERVYFGATIADATAAGFNELHLSAADVLRLGRSPVDLRAGLLAPECRDLLQVWQARPHRRPY